MTELDNKEIKAKSTLVGAGIGSGFANTNELKVTSYKESMQSPDRVAWEEEIENEFKWFEKFNVFTVVSCNKLPSGAKVMSMSWAMKR